MKVEDYVFIRGDTRAYSVGATRDEAYKNLSPVYRNELKPEDGVKLSDLPRVSDDGLTTFLKQHQAEVDDG